MAYTTESCFHFTRVLFDRFVILKSWANISAPGRNSICSLPSSVNNMILISCRSLQSCIVRMMQEVIKFAFGHFSAFLKHVTLCYCMDGRANLDLEAISEFRYQHYFCEGNCNSYWTVSLSVGIITRLRGQLPHPPPCEK